MQKDLEQKAIELAAKLIPFAERFDCVELGEAINVMGDIAGFDEPVIPAAKIHVGNPVAVILTRMPSNDKRVWYAVPLT